MNEKFSEYLKDLPPELQEKAKDIKTNEELMEFLSENDVELPEDVLEAVAGGGACENDDCPKGGKHDYRTVGRENKRYKCICNKCGYETTKAPWQLV